MSLWLQAASAAREALSLVDGIALNGLRIGTDDDGRFVELDVDLWHPSLHLDRSVHRLEVHREILVDLFERRGTPSAIARDLVKDLDHGRTPTEDERILMDAAIALIDDDDALVRIVRRHAERLVDWQRPRACRAAKLGIPAPIPVHVIPEENEFATMRRMRVGHLSIDALTLDIMLANASAADVVATIRRIAYECVDPQGLDLTGPAGAVIDGDTMRALNLSTELEEWMIGRNATASFPVDVQGLLTKSHTTVEYHDGVVTLREREIPDTTAAVLVGRPDGSVADVPAPLAAMTIVRIEGNDEDGIVLRVDRPEDVLLRDHPAIADVLDEMTP